MTRRRRPGLTPKIEAVDTTTVTLGDLFAGFALTGYLSAQGGEVDKRLACRWAITMGRLMLRESRPALQSPPRTKRPRRHASHSS